MMGSHSILLVLVKDELAIWDEEMQQRVKIVSRKIACV